MSPSSRERAPGHYWEVEVELAPEAEELWGLFCYDRGASGAQTVRETAAGLTVRYFFASGEPAGARQWTGAFRAAYPGVAPPRRLAVRRKAAEDWQDGWRVHFRPTPVGRGLLICPPWEVPAPPARGGRQVVVIEPGQAFGTGGHASTVLALELLERCLAEEAPPAAMLDVGIGSGVLAAAARLLGAGEVWGLDVDGRVMAEVRRNFALTGLAPAPRLVRGRPDCLARCFPLVAANLTTPALQEHCGDLAALTAPGGTLIAAGILRREREAVARACGAAGCRVAETTEREEWCALRLTRPA